MYGSDFGFDWRTATEKDVRGWLKSTGGVKVKVKVKGDDDGTPLHSAARKNRSSPAIISTLIKQGPM